MECIQEKAAISEKERRLRKKIQSLSNEGRVMVAFSGGVDSSLLLWECVQALGAERVTAVTATSPTSIPGELESAKEFADSLGVQHLVVIGGECEDESFLRNSENRCYICKNIRYNKLIHLAEERGISTIMDGTQADDRPEERPGMRALAELGIDIPLAESGLGKEEIRALLCKAGLIEISKKNAQPCLATRIPFGRAITRDALDRIREGELFLQGLGLKTVRLRDHFPIARVMSDSDGISVIATDGATRMQIVERLKQLGYEHVTLDLKEYGA